MKDKYKSMEDFGWSFQYKDDSCIKYYKNGYLLYFFIKERKIQFSYRRNLLEDLEIDLYELKAINRKAKEIWKTNENNEGTRFQDSTRHRQFSNLGISTT